MERGRRWLCRGWERLYGTVNGFLENDCSNQSAALAYYAFVSLFPGILLFLTVLTEVLARVEAQNRIVELIQFYFPLPSFKEYLIQNIRGTLRLRGIMGFIGAIGLLWSAKAVFISLERGLNLALRLGHQRPTWVAWLVATLATLVFGLLLVGQMMFLAFMRGVLAFQVPLLGWSLADMTLATTLVQWLLSPLLMFCVFTALYSLLPVKRPPLREAMEGALFAAVAYRVVEYAFLAYSAYIARVSAVYGAASIILALMLWLYLSANVFFLGAEFIYTGLAPDWAAPPALGSDALFSPREVAAVHAWPAEAAGAVRSRDESSAPCTGPSPAEKAG